MQLYFVTAALPITKFGFTIIATYSPFNGMHAVLFRLSLLCRSKTGSAVTQLLSKTVRSCFIRCDLPSFGTEEQLGRVAQFQSTIQSTWSLHSTHSLGWARFAQNQLKNRPNQTLTHRTHSRTYRVEDSLLLPSHGSNAYSYAPLPPDSSSVCGIRTAPSCNID